MEEALVNLLLADSDLSALVGPRIHWDEIPQGSADPAVTLFLVSGVPDYHMAGPSGLVASRVQIDCRGPSKEVALSVARAVEAVLSGLKTTIGSIKFDSVMKINARSEFEKSATPAYRLESADYRIWHGLAA